MQHRAQTVSQILLLSSQSKHRREFRAIWSHRAQVAGACEMIIGNRADNYTTLHHTALHHKTLHHCKTGGALLFNYPCKHGENMQYSIRNQQHGPAGTYQNGHPTPECCHHSTQRPASCHFHCEKVGLKASLQAGVHDSSLYVHQSERAPSHCVHLPCAFKTTAHAPDRPHTCHSVTLL